MPKGNHELLGEFIQLARDPDRAKELTDAANARLAELDREREVILKVIEVLDGSGSAPAAPVQSGKSVVVAERGSRPKASGGGHRPRRRRIIIKDALETILTESGRPMRIEDLVGPVERMRGKPLGGKTAQHTLYGTIAQADKLTSKRGWVGLTKWPDSKWQEAGSAPKEGEGAS